jgi:hypothetical protein
LWKVFDPPLPAKTKVQITLGINTLALGTTTPAASCILNPIVYTYDSQSAGARKATYYSPINSFPQPAGVTAGTEIGLNLGTFQRKEKAILLIAEDPVGTPVDTYLGECTLDIDGTPINFSNAPDLKKQYLHASDGIAVPAGFHEFIVPNGGFEAAVASQFQLHVIPYLSTATGQIRGYEVFEKNY